MAKKKTSKPKKCSCINEINKALEPHNTRLATQMALNFATRDAAVYPSIETVKIDTKKRGRKRSIVPTYCPFCGEKYP